MGYQPRFSLLGFSIKNVHVIITTQKSQVLYIFTHLIPKRMWGPCQIIYVYNRVKPVEDKVQGSKLRI